MVQKHFASGTCHSCATSVILAQPIRILVRSHIFLVTNVAGI
uniref:Uncharacterized protein n=1 Tax=Arundo donax TaxID=35708 RepID=A0A0A9HV21_ARUDO